MTSDQSLVLKDMKVLLQVSSFFIFAMNFSILGKTGRLECWKLVFRVQIPVILGRIYKKYKLKTARALQVIKIIPPKSKELRSLTKPLHFHPIPPCILLQKNLQHPEML